MLNISTDHSTHSIALDPSYSEATACSLTIYTTAFTPINMLEDNIIVRVVSR